MGYSLTQEGMDVMGVLDVFSEELKKGVLGPPEVEFSYGKIMEATQWELRAKKFPPVEEDLYSVLERMVNLGLLEYSPD